MRLKDYDERDGKRVWLSEKEIQLLLNHARPNHAPEQAALLLAARCGLRREEITDVTPAHVTDNDTGWVVRVWEGKGDKYREVPAPNALVNQLVGMDTPNDEPLADVDPSTIYDWVHRIGETLYSETGETGWRFVGPHDLRRSWGVRLLETGVLPSLVMEWGGWNDWKTFRDHYLAEFSPEAVRRERGKVSWLGGDGDAGELSYAIRPPRSEFRG